MDTHSSENYLIHIMNNGFARAAVSFSQLIQRPVQIVNAHSVLVRQEGTYPYISEEQGDLYILITHIIGDISGKSFLIFTMDESHEIFRTLNPSIASEALNEAFLMEIDNIISAAVIAELSNALNLEIYGDVPKLSKVHSKDLQTFLNKEINKEDPGGMIYCNTTFQFDKKERIHPQFIWKLSSKVFEIIPTKRATV